MAYSASLAVFLGDCLTRAPGRSKPLGHLSGAHDGHILNAAREVIADRFSAKTKAIIAESELVIWDCPALVNTLTLSSEVLP